MAIPYAQFGLGLVQTLMNRGAQRQANDINAANLNFQRQNADRQFQLATADRTDAYGNRIRYTPGQGFDTIVDPLIQALLNAQTREQTQNLTVDQPMQREARGRRDSRSRMADEQFGDLFRTMVSRERTTPEAESAVEVRRAVDRHNRSDGERIDPASVIRQQQAVNPAAIGRGRDLVSTIADAQTRGRERGVSQEAQQSQLEMALIDAMRQIANDTSEVAPAQTNIAEVLASRSDGAQAAGGQALASGGQAVGNAFSALSQSASRPIDLSGLIDLVGNLEQPDKLETALTQQTQMNGIVQQLLQRTQGQQELSSIRGNQGRF